jgi:hypothetical protein
VELYLYFPYMPPWREEGQLPFIFISVFEIYVKQLRKVKENFS